MQTTYKVGDKVRVLNKDGIYGGDDLTNGEVYEVTMSTDSEGDIRIKDDDGYKLLITTDELKYIEKVAEQVAKFKVGDKVRIIGVGAAGLPIGTEAKVTQVDWDGGVYLDIKNVHGNKAFYLACNIELVSPKPTKKQRLTSAEQAISTLEQKVEAMQAEIDALKAAQSIGKSAEAIVKANEKHSPNEQASANEKRKAIIAEAKAFVEKNLAEVDEQMGWRTTNIPVYKEYGRLRIEFIVNAEKRTVVALARYGNIVDDPTVHGKGIAKCNPSDVFNADIGKAIALGRALGLDVSKFEKAVQPTEFAVGQTIKADLSTQTYIDNIIEVSDGKAYVKGGGFYWQDRITQNNYQIINDTEAQY